MKTSFLLALCLCLPMAAAKEGGHVKIIAADYPPIAIESEEGQGFVAETVKAALKEEGLETKIVFLPFKRALNVFEEEGGLIFSSFGILEPGNYKMVEMVKLRGGIFGFKGQGKIQKVAYIRGLDNAKKIIAEKGYVPFPVSGYFAALKALVSGRVQGVVAIDLPLKYVAKTSFPEKSKKLSMLVGPTHYEPGGVVGPEKELAKLKVIRKGLLKIKEKGLYKKTARKYLEDYLEKDLDQYLSNRFEILSHPGSKD